MVGLEIVMVNLFLESRVDSLGTKNTLGKNSECISILVSVRVTGAEGPCNENQQSDTNRMYLHIFS